MATIERQAPHLKPVLVKYGKPTPKVGAPGGWELHVTARGTMSGVLNSSSAAYDALAKSSIIPRPKPLPSPKPKPVAIPKGPKVMFGPVDFSVAQLMVAPMAASANADQREAVDADIEAAGQIQESARAAGARAATRVRQKTMTKRKYAGRVVVHGYSRRYGKTVRDFKRRSPRQRMRVGRV